MSNPFGHIPLPALTQASASSTPRTRRRRRWPKVVLGLIALLLLLVWLAPVVVARTAFRNRLARIAGSELNGTFEIGGATLSWLSPVELRDITLRDPQGRVVVRIDRVTSSKSLLSLARNRSDLGEFTFEAPAVDVVCRSKGTNLEELIANYLTAETPPSSTRTPLVVRVVRGSVSLTDEAIQQSSDFRDIEATVSVPRSRKEPVTISANANALGRVAVEVSAGNAVRLRLDADDFDTDRLKVLLPRFAPNLKLGGRLAGKLTSDWSADAAKIEGEIKLTSFTLATPELEGDTLRLADAKLQLRASLAGRKVQIDCAEFASEVGSISVVGAFDPDEPLDRLLQRPGTKLDASVHLAKLAATLPKFLGVRAGTEIHEGTITLRLASGLGELRTNWSGGITTTALKATRDGKEVRWEQPLSIDFEGHVVPGRRMPNFDKIVCQSDFVAINARVSPEEVRAAANIHLDRLAQHLGDFVDIGGWSLDGRGSAWVVAKRGGDGQFKAEGGLELKQFAATDRDGKGLREPSLNAQFATTGRANDAGPVSLDTASVALQTAEGDALDARLIEPIPDAGRLSAGKLDVALNGDLGRWRKRIAAFAPIPSDYRFAGVASARGVVRFMGNAIHIDGLALSIDKAKLFVEGISIDEQNVNATANVTVRPDSGAITFDEFTLNSSPLSVAIGRLTIEPPANGPVVVTGSGPAVSDLNHLGKSLGMYADPHGPTSLRGKAVGPIRFRTSGGVTNFAGALDVADFSYGVPNDPDWAEKRMRVELDGSYTSSTAALALAAAKVERPGLLLAGTGSVSNFGTTTDANLSGTLAYDMTKLTPKIRQLLGGSFTASGQGSQPFRLAGSLTPLPDPNAKRPPNPFASLAVDVGIGWDSLKAYGFDVGRSEFTAKLERGMLRVTPVVATFGGGKVRVHPSARLDPAPGGLTLAKGVIVEKARLTPEACASALGFALPAIAHSSKAEGEISVTLDENHIPLGNVNRAKAKGAVHIHKATVTAGPVVGAVATLLGADKAVMTLANDQTVPVRVENGRVYHDDLSIKLGGYFVKTSGSVGFDGTVELTADVPIPGGLPGLNNTPAIAKVLTGKRIAVPIRGTLSAPVLDQRAFQAAIAKLAQDAAKDVGKDLLNKELNKLFPDGLPVPGGLIPYPKR